MSEHNKRINEKRKQIEPKKKPQITDIVVLSYQRLDLLKQCLSSIWRYSIRYRLIVIDDGSNKEIVEYLVNNRKKFYQIILNGGNYGVVPNTNVGLSLSFLHRQYWGESDNIPLLLMESDMVFTGYWQEKFEKAMTVFPHVTFVSGHDSPEHKFSKQVIIDGTTYKLKRIISACTMYAYKPMWQQIGLIPEKNIDGSERGKPHNDKSDNRDWWFMRHAPNSVDHKGLFCTVVCGITKHIGLGHSTWRTNEAEDIKTGRYFST